MRHQDQQTQDDQRYDHTPDHVDETDRTGDADRTKFDETDRTDETDRVEFHEPAPLPTTFGAPTVGGAVAASAMASGNRTDQRDARDDETVGPDNGLANDQETSTQALAPNTDSRVTDEPGTDNRDTGDGTGPLLDPETAQRLRSRWRDVQLRFVDDPQAALGEARGLVGEAVDSLTTALTEQRSRLDTDGGAGTDGDAGETERIRVAIRHYRDFLDRVVAR
jgi:hypothetical protein